MDAPMLLLIVVPFLVLWYSCVFILRSYSSRGISHKLPPGPCPYPIIGNLFQIDGIIHGSLAKLSRTYGPLMSLKLGKKVVIVVSSPEVAKELLQRHDLQVSSRGVPDAARALDHYRFSTFWLPAVNKWRNLRKLCKEQLFSSERLNASEGLRQEKVQELCRSVHQCCIHGQAVDIGEAAFTTSLNLISNTLFSVDFGEHNSNSSQELKEVVWSVMKILGVPNVADFFPVFKVIDPQGIRRQAKLYMGKLLDTFDVIIEQRLQGRRASPTYLRRNDLLEVLLDLSQRNEADWHHKDMKHLFLDLFVAGTDTTSTTVEWAMAELLRNPEKMQKATAEIREVVGLGKIVQESDISRLPYLQALVKETFRLHPAGALLVRQAETDIKIDQYLVPKDAQLLVNLWAIGRDESLWPNPDSFLPERFLDSEIDAKGQHFQLLAFGTGRRICMGLPLAHQMVHLMLASLIHNFDWKLEEGMNPENMDMSEKVGITVQKALPLKAIPVGAPV